MAINLRRIKKRARHHRQPRRVSYSDTRTAFDASEASHLISQGWRLLEHVTVSRWAAGYHSESTSYVLGLPRVQAVPVA